MPVPLLTKATGFVDTQVGANTIDGANMIGAAAPTRGTNTIGTTAPTPRVHTVGGHRDDRNDRDGLAAAAARP
jgi:hypothetical protein